MNKTELKISAVNEVKVGAAKVMLALDLHKFSFLGLHRELEPNETSCDDPM